MKIKNAPKMGVIIALLGLYGGIAEAQTVEVTVSAKSGPWTAAEYPGHYYGDTINNGTSFIDMDAPTIVDLTAGATSVTIDYVSGSILDQRTNAVFSASAAGANSLLSTCVSCVDSGYVNTPGQYTGQVTNEYSLLASFANSSGKEIGDTLFQPGNDDTVNVPTGATEMFLGINTNTYNTYDFGSYSADGKVGGYVEDVTMNQPVSSDGNFGGDSSGGVSGGVPETPTYLMALIGIAAVGGFSLRKRVA